MFTTLRQVSGVIAGKNSWSQQAHGFWDEAYLIESWILGHLACLIPHVIGFPPNPICKKADTNYVRQPYCVSCCSAGPTTSSLIGILAAGRVVELRLSPKQQSGWTLSHLMSSLLKCISGAPGRQCIRRTVWHVWLRVWRSASHLKCGPFMCVEVSLSSAILRTC